MPGAGLPSGGGGSGDLVSTNNLSDVASATTSRTNLGVGTADSPQFAGIELGNASDTTLSRSSAGVVAVEGTALLKSGGALGTPSGGTLTNCGSLPVSGITASTVTALGVGSIELGHASDTTISRTGAGAIAVEGAAVLLSGGALGTPSGGTLTNCSGLPASGLVASTSQAVGFGSIELGHASDTTISRTGAGAIAVEGATVLLSGAALGTPASGTLTNCSGTLSNCTGSPALNAPSVDASDANGAKLTVAELTENVTIAAAAFSNSASNLLPANALILAVVYRVTTAVAGTATFDIGIAGATTRYGSGISTNIDTTGFGNSATFYANATAIRITPNTTPSDANGRIRVTVFYLAPTPPTS